MRKKIRLGPFAVFIAVITIILSMLAILSLSTAHADETLAKRYAEVTQIKYELERRGSVFLYELEGEALPESLSGRENVQQKEDGTWAYTDSAGSYSLEIVFEIKDGACHVIKQNIRRTWEEEETFLNVWQP